MKIIFLFILVATQSLVCCKKAEPEIFLIPEKFSGKIQIIYNQNGIPLRYKNGYGKDTIYTPKIGEPIKYENGARVYKIPEIGILLTQFSSNNGIINQKYFLVNKNGKRVPLPVFGRKKKNINHANIDKNKIGIFAHAIVGVYGNQNIPYQEFVVSNFNEVDSFYTFEYEKVFTEKLHETFGVDY